ncbi:MAG: FixG Ig-like domain-containing protein, partial [Halobacteriaceae archaeon]
FGIANFKDDRPPETCAISTGHGLLQDRDCDDVPNRADNCVNTPNPTQSDQNRNGRGNACDLYIKTASIEPSKRSCGQSTMASMRIVNNLGELQDIQASFAIKSVTDTIKHISLMEPGAAQTIRLTARLPQHVDPGSYTSVLELTSSAGTTHVAREIEVTDQTCGTKAENSSLHVTEIEEASPDGTAVYPMKITNYHDTAQSYQVVVKGIDFGTYALDPGSVVLIGPGETRTVYLSVNTAKDVGRGSKSFTVEVQRGDDVEQVTLVADIHAKDHGEYRSTVWIGGISLLFLTVVATVLDNYCCFIYHW